MAVLVVNAGSTSLKLHRVDHNDSAEQVDSLDAVDPSGLEGVAHRVVHGGPRFRDPVVIDAAVRTQIFELEALAPLHNAPALVGIEDAERRFPQLQQVAVFDTGFHQTIPEEAAVYAVPRPWREQWGIRRYGFHGLSVQWCAEQVQVPRLVVCHLGGGCSVSAVQTGRSIDTTMGFSPLEGVPMATRSGSIDPGALIYLLREQGVDAEALEHALNVDSGLKGLGGGSGDMRELEQRARAGAADAALALDVFIHRLAAAAAAMAAALGGLDALAFTAGIGENSPLVRERLCERLRFLGLDLDLERNMACRGDCDIAAPHSPARIVVVRAREELIAARQARALLAQA